MRLYPQFIIWTYILLPAICLFLAPAFVSLFVKAQQQKVKILADAINAKARTAAALAKHQAKMQQFRNSPFSNDIGLRDRFKMRSRRDVEETMPLKRTHWDQQEESMGQLQNMWNMNMNNMMNDGILREADPHKKKKHNKHGKKFRSSEQIDNLQEFEALGSPRIYDDKRKYGDGPESYTGSFFGRNVYDDVLTQASEPIENESARSHKKKYKKYKKKGHDYTYYSDNYYRDAEAPIIMENAPREDMIMHEPNLMSVHVIPMQDLHFEPHDDHMDDMLREQAPNLLGFNLELPQDHPPIAFRRNNENDELVMHNMPQDIMVMEPNLIPSKDLQQEARSSSHLQDLFKNPDILRSLPNIYDDTSYGSSYGSSYGNYDSSYGKPSKTVKKFDLYGKQLGKLDKHKTLDVYGGYGNDYDYDKGKLQYDPLILYEKTLQDLADINKKIAEDTKELLTPKKIYKIPKIYPQIPVAHFIDDYSKNDDGYINGGYINNPTNGGYIGGADLYKEAKKADPDPSHSHTITHSHSFTHHSDLGLSKKHPLRKLAPKPNDHFNKAEAHSKALHFKHGGFSQADSKSISHGTTPNLFEETHAYGQSISQAAAAQAAAQANSGNNNFNNGGFNQASAQAAAQANSGNNNFNNGGFSQAAAQANSGNQFNSGRFGQTQSAAQANSANHINGGFSQAQSAAQAQDFSGHSNAQSVAKANSGGFSQSAAQASGGFAQANAQANANNNWNNGASAQAASQSFSNPAFGQPHAAAQGPQAPQFFQVLAPSNFVNARSNDDNQRKPNAGFVMPHLQQIPVADTLHGMLDKNSRSTRSHSFGDGLNLASSIVGSSLALNRPEDQKTASFVGDIVDSSLRTGTSDDSLKNKRHSADNIFKGLNLASGIVHASLNNPLVQKHERPNNENVQEAMNLASGIVDSSLKVDNLDSVNIPDGQRDSLESPERMFSSISDIVHQSVRHKRQIFEGNNNNYRCRVMTENNNDAVVGSGPENNVPRQDIPICPVMIENNNEAMVRPAPEQKIPQRDATITEPARASLSKIDQDHVDFKINDQQQKNQENSEKWNNKSNNDAMVRPAPEQNIPRQDATISEPARAPLSKMDPDHVDFKNKDSQQKNQENNEKWNNESTNFDDEMIEMINPDDPEFTTTNAPPEEADKRANPLLVDDLKVIVHPSKDNEGFYDELENQQKVESTTVYSISSSTENSSGVAPTEGPDPIQQDESTFTDPTVDRILAFIEPNKNISLLTPEEIEDIQFGIPDVTEGKHAIETQQPDSELLGSPHNVTESASKDPLASIEKEMSILTEEEQEAFIKQEMALIADFIEETLHKEPLPHPTEKPHQESEILKTEDHHKVSKDKHHEVTTIKEPETVTKMNAESLPHQSTVTPTENKQESHLIPPPHPVVNPQNSGSTQEPQVPSERLSSPHLFQAYDRNIGHETYDRRARAASPLDQTFDEIVGAQREKLQKIHNEAHQNADLMFISFIGESLIKDLENSRREVEEKARSSRPKRKIDHLNPNYYPIEQLIKDPRTKIDVPKTLENVGTVVRNTFEDPRAPMYHLRSLLGNTKNTVMAAAKVPPNNILLPTQYEVTKLSEDVGAINPMINSRSGFDDTEADPFGILNTFQQIGEMVQGSVNSGKDVVRHANDVASDMKQVLYTTKNVAPLLTLPSQIPVITSRFAGPTPANQAIFVAPRVLDLVGTAQEPLPRQFVGMGNILDAVGVSKPNHPDYKMKRIRRKPIEGKRQHFLDPEQEEKPKPELKTFFNKMHQEMKEILTAQHQERKRKLKEPVSRNHKKDYEFSKKKSTTNSPSINYDRVIDEHKHVTLPPEILGIFSQNYPDSNQNDQVGLKLQPELMKPFMGQPSEDEFSEFMRENGDEEALEKINKEEFRRQSQPVVTETPVAIKSRFQNLDENDRVGLNLQPELMKPFMGQPSEHEFREFMRENGDEVPLGRKNENDSRRQVLNHTPVTVCSRSQHVDQNHQVGLKFQPGLMKPFMEHPPQDKSSEYVRKNKDVINKPGFQHFDKNAENEDQFMEENEVSEGRNFRKPLVYEIFPFNFNITIPADGELKPINLRDYLPFEPTAEEDMIVGQENLQDAGNMDENNSTGRVSMMINDKFQKPFLGLVEHDKVHKFLNKYGNSLSENGEHYDYDYPQEIYHPVKSVVYSNDNDDYFIW